MKKDDLLYIGHILDAIEKIDGYLKGVDVETFVKTDLLVDATARELLIIGEAANRLSDRFEQEHPEIPFRDIIGMRNILIHDYTGVETIFLWKTYKEDLPKLKDSLLPLRSE